MADGPNYEQVFRGMQCLNGGTPDDCKIIKQYLRFYQDSEEFPVFATHYIPILPEADRAEFESILQSKACKGECGECECEETEQTEEVSEEVSETEETSEELSIEEVNAKLAELGVEVHHASGERKRREALTKALSETE